MKLTYMYRYMQLLLPLSLLGMESVRVVL